MIYITGDTHASLGRFSRKIFPEQAEMTKDDYMIITGDFGGVWYGCDDAIHQKTEHYQLDKLDSRPFTTLFVPGNHENYARLMSDEFPKLSWHGGLIKQIRPSVLMLMRGEMYELDGVKVFAFGGARSQDTFHGILDGNDPDWKTKAENLRRQGKIFYRIKGLSWWPEELPSQEELQHGLEILEKNHWQTDFVVTHCAPSGIQAQLGFHESDYLTRYLEDIQTKLDYRYWFFGHYHLNRNVTARDIVLCEQIIRIH